MRRIAIHAERAVIDGSIRPACLAVADRLLDAPESEATIRLDERYILLPGMINAHDHLDFNSFPVLGRAGAYADVYEWAAEIGAQKNSPEIRAALSIPLEDRLRIGGLKNLSSGVTTVAHHNPYHACFRSRFPVRVVEPYAWSHSLGLDRTAEQTFRATPQGVPWIIHAAEGFSERAAREIGEMNAMGLLASNTVVVHGLAARPEDLRLARDRGAGIVSCPVSNRFLYGRTLDYNAIPDGLPLALGSDSAVSAGAGLHEDLRVLRSLVNWPAERLWSLVTTSPARLFSIPNRLPDLTVLRDDEPELVIVGGEVRLSGEEFRHLFHEPPRRIRVRGHVRFVSSRIEIPWQSVARAAEWTPYLREFML